MAVNSTAIASTTTVHARSVARALRRSGRVNDKR